MRKFFAFYREVFRRAFSGKFWLFEKWTGGFAAVALLVAITFDIADDDKAMITEYVPAISLLILFFGTLIIGLVLAPVKMFEEQVEEVKRLKLVMKPKLEIFLENHGVRRLRHVSVTRAYFTENTHFGTGLPPYDLISVGCSNTGRDTLKSVSCKMILAEIEEEGENDFARIWASAFGEAVPLQWNTDEKNPEYAVNIEHSEKRFIYLAKFIFSGEIRIFGKPSNLPSEYKALLGAGGAYSVILQFKSENPDPYYVHLKIESMKRNEENQIGSHYARTTIIDQSNNMFRRELS